MEDFNSFDSDIYYDEVYEEGNHYYEIPDRQQLFNL